MSHSKLKHAGFSLIEVLIAITILGFISLGITTFTDSSIDSAIRISQEDIEALQIETAMSRLEWDVSHIYTPLYFEQMMNPQGMTPEEGEIYNQLADFYQNNNNFNLLSFSGIPTPVIKTPEKSQLVFFTASHRRKVANEKSSTYAWVRYELQPDQLTQAEREEIGTPTQMLVRKSFTSDVFTSDAIDWEDIKTQVLLHKVISLQFEFWDYQNEKWVGNINTIKDGMNILRGLRVTIKYLTPTNNENISVRVFKPLFNYFEPEDMYKFLKAKTSANGGPDGQGNGNETQPNGNGQDDGDDQDDQ